MWHNTFNDLPKYFQVIVLCPLLYLWFLLMRTLAYFVMIGGFLLLHVFMGFEIETAATTINLIKYPAILVCSYGGLRLMEAFTRFIVLPRFLRYVPKE